MEKIKKVLKRSAAAALYYSGIASQKRLREKNIILGYHRVLPEGHPITHFIQPGMYVTQNTFELHLRFLKKNFELLKLSELNLEPQAKGQCVVTFDDGWFDNYEFALPLLKKYDIPATIFLSTGYIGTNDWPWPDKLSYVFCHAEKEIHVNILALLADFLGTHKNEILYLHKVTPVKLRADLTIGFAKRLAWDKLREFILRVEKISEKHMMKLNDLRAWMTWDEVARMEANGVEFASHTHNHVILNEANKDKIEDELSVSTEILKENLGTYQNLFSYPNGEYCDELIMQLKKFGISRAVTTESGYVDHKSDPFLLKRFLVHNDISDSVAELVNILSQTFIY